MHNDQYGDQALHYQYLRFDISRDIFSSAKPWSHPHGDARLSFTCATRAETHADGYSVCCLTDLDREMKEMTDSTIAGEFPFGHLLGHCASNMTSHYLRSVGAAESIENCPGNVASDILGRLETPLSEEVASSSSAWNAAARHLGHRSSVAMGYWKPADDVPDKG